MRLLRFLIFFTIVISLCLSLIGCGFLFNVITKTEFNFLYETSEIELIQIVTIGEITQTPDTSSENTTEVYTPKFDVICNIREIESFIDDFSTIDCHRSFPPVPPTLGDTGIKIIYKNGDYDIICCIGQGEYRDGFYYADSGTVSFDKTKFNELINIYTNDTTNGTK